MERGFDRRAAVLAFVVAFSTLFTQILIHRLVMAKLVNNFAFLVISLTMLGFAFSGVILTRWREWFIANTGAASVFASALFVVSLIGSSALFCRAPDRSWVASRPELVLDFLRLMPWAILLALPFGCCGLILGLLLTRPDLATRRIYFADLCGSALGAFAVLPAISRLGVEESLIAAGALMLVFALLLSPPRSRGEQGAVLVASVFILWSATHPARVFHMAYPQGSMLAEAENPASGWKIEHMAWDPLARIEVTHITPPDPTTFSYPSLIGEDRAFLSRFRRVLTQNNNAFTYALDYDGKRESLKGIEQTIYAAAYQIRSVEQPRVLVIGVGGGFDILNALYFGAASARGVEVNAATVGILVRTYHDYFRSWVEDPRFRLVKAEGRHYLATTDDRFDVIQLSGVDSVSGTPAAAHVFMENYLYTAEAFDLYLSRLSEGGVLNMMRQEWDPPRHMLRALVTAVEALRRAGVQRPADHIIMVSATNGNFAAMLVKKSPFSDEEIARVESWTAGVHSFQVSARPRPARAGRSLYQVFLDLGDAISQATFVSRYPFDISAVTDNRPFFFRHSFWWHLYPSDPAMWAEIPFMEYTLILLLVMIGLVAVVCVYVPLRHLSRREGPTRGSWRYGLFFASTGLGYLAVEIALLQKYSLFLGHPNYALSVVLAALLFSSGIGSLFSGQIVGAMGGLRFVGYAVGALLLVEWGLVMDPLLSHEAWPFWVRCLIVLLLVAPIGVLLGTFLPSGLERLKAEQAPAVAWAWGVNGTFSVLAPVLAVGLSMTWGINALLLSAVPLYLVVGWSLPAALSSEASSRLDGAPVPHRETGT